MINLSLHITLLAGLLISGVVSHVSPLTESIPISICDRCASGSPSIETATVKGSLILRMSPGPCTITHNKFDKQAAETYIKKCIKDPALIIKL
jgi:hypothetical protein